MKWRQYHPTAEGSEHRRPVHRHTHPHHTLHKLTDTHDANKTRSSTHKHHSHTRSPAPRTMPESTNNRSAARNRPGCKWGAAMLVVVLVLAACGPRTASKGSVASQPQGPHGLRELDSAESIYEVVDKRPTLVVVISKWCGWSKKLLSSGELEKASQQVPVLIVDYAKHPQVPNELLCRTFNALQRKCNRMEILQGFPTTFPSIYAMGPGRQHTEHAGPRTGAAFIQTMRRVSAWGFQFAMN